MEPLYKKLAGLLVISLHLDILMWSTFWTPYIDTKEHWMPQTFFTPSNQPVIRIQNTPVSFFHTALVNTIAMMGGMGNIYTAFGRLENARVGARKYFWICYIPWIIAFTGNWLKNVVAFVVLLSVNEFYEASNCTLAVALFTSLFAIQLLYASEIVCMAFQEWVAMEYINAQNILWDIAERMF